MARKIGREVIKCKNIFSYKLDMHWVFRNPIFIFFNGEKFLTSCVKK